MLQVVEVFSDTFGLKISIIKSCVVIIRDTKWLPAAVGRHCWFYKGQQLTLKDEVVYLGLEHHGWKQFRVGSSDLMVAANRARFAVQNRIEACGITVPELMMRPFQTLVTPVLSYGCQVWGVDAMDFTNLKTMLDSPWECMQLSFMRYVSGASKGTTRWAMLREFSWWPVALHWLKLVVRFWNRLVENDEWIAHDALSDNLALAVEGSTSCWSYRFLSILQSIGLLDSSFYYMQQMTMKEDVIKQVFRVRQEAVSGLLAMTLDEGGLIQKVKDYIFDKVWRPLHLDPRLCPSDGAMACKYYRWFDPVVGRDGCKTFGRHVSCCSIPRGKYMNLMRFRLGCWDLEVNMGKRVGVERHQRKCRVCNSGQVEDEFHTVFECSEYDRIRSRMESVFTDHSTMSNFFNQHDQAGVADFLSEVRLARMAKLSIKTVKVVKGRRKKKKKAAVFTA
jgi:hypothetical protein